jgi:hypothetical protein
MVHLPLCVVFRHSARQGFAVQKDEDRPRCDSAIAVRNFRPTNVGSILCNDRGAASDACLVAIEGGNGGSRHRSLT